MSWRAEVRNGSFGTQMGMNSGEDGWKKLVGN